MNCPQCGSYMTEGASFCPSCGAYVPAAPAPEAPPAAPAYEPAPAPAAPAYEPRHAAPAYAPAAPARPARPARNRPAVAGLVMNVIELMFWIIAAVAARNVTYTYGTSFVVTLVFAGIALIFYMLPFIFGLVGFIRSLVTKVHIPQGIIALLLLIVNSIIPVALYGTLAYLFNYAF